MKNLLFLFLIVILSCTSRNYKNETYQADSTVAIKDFYDTEAEAVNKLDKLTAQKVFDSLKSKFLVTKDDFNKTEWYTHKTFGKFWPNRKTIYTEVRNDGYFNVVSNYYADDWLFHKMIYVMIGDNKMQTEEVETYKPTNKTDNKGGEIWENITYDIVNRSILNEIAKDINKTVKLRFEGRQFYKDATVSMADKKAIKESLLLAESLKSLIR